MNSKEIKSVAITGATSMIGAALAAECVKSGIEVVAFVRKNSRKLDCLPDSPMVHIVEAELDELGLLAWPAVEHMTSEPYPESSETEKSQLYQQPKTAVTEEDRSYQQPKSAVTEETPASSKPEAAGTEKSLASSQQKAPAKVDVFYHIGWATGRENRGNVQLQADNIRYTLDAVELAARMGAKRFIGAGSQAEYGTPNQILTASTEAKPLTPYGIAKLAAGGLSRIACEQQGIEHIWVRVLSVYGTHDKPTTLISQLMQHAIADEPMELSGCEQTWDYLYESDAGKAFLETGRSGISGKIYVLGSGVGMRLRSYVDTVTKLVNQNYHRDYQPEFGRKAYGATQPMHLQADISELTNDTGWKPETSFEDGMRELMKRQR